MALRANTHVANTSKHGFRNGENAFWGERIRGNVNNSCWVNHLAKDLKAEKRDKKVKPGAAYAVITSNNRKEVVVSEILYDSPFSILERD